MHAARQLQSVHPEPNDTQLEQAAHWYACLRDGHASEQQKAQWNAWLNANPLHKQAWQWVEQMSAEFDPLRQAPQQSAQTLTLANQRLKTRRQFLTGLAALSGTGLLGWLGWQTELYPNNLMAYGADYRTETGEQRQITLADGTHIWLNTQTAINLQYSDKARRIQLLRGEIYIETATDAQRPFSVANTHGLMTALGTAFTIRQEKEQTLLAVYQGAVKIRTQNGDQQIIEAGSQTHFNKNNIALYQPAELARQVWKRGILAIDNLTLREVIDELNRYHKGHISLAPEISHLTVYGNFPIQDTQRVLNMLASALPIQIKQPLPWWTQVQ